MDTAFPVRTHRAGTRSWSSPLLAATAAVAIVLVGALVVLFAQQFQAPAAQSASDGLNPQQIVIRGEVADRLAQSASDGLNPQQIVIRGEVADRLAQSAGDGLNPQQIVIRGEVADRLAQSAGDGP
jgi:hypothetical protein